MKALPLIAALLLIGCGGDKMDDNPDVMAMLPDAAYSVQYVGNGWVTFFYDNSKFLLSPTGGVALSPVGPFGPKRHPQSTERQP